MSSTTSTPKMLVFPTGWTPFHKVTGNLLEDIRKYAHCFWYEGAIDKYEDDAHSDVICFLPCFEELKDEDEESEDEGYEG